jgi:hypothetical protein
MMRLSYRRARRDGLHKVKAAGCNVGFVKAELEIDKKGVLTIRS